MAPGEVTVMFSLATTPETPKNFKLRRVPSDSSVEVRWRAPLSDNASPVKGYRLQFRFVREVGSGGPDGGGAQEGPAVGRSSSFVPLTEWQTAEYVDAELRGGSKLQDEESSSSDDDELLHLRSYKRQHAYRRTVGDLPAGAAVQLRVSAENSAGFGTPAYLLARTKAAAPGRPRKPRLIHALGQMHWPLELQWSAPERYPALTVEFRKPTSDGGSRIVAYHLILVLEESTMLLGGSSSLGPGSLNERGEVLVRRFAVSDLLQVSVEEGLKTRLVLPPVLELPSLGRRGFSQFQLRICAESEAGGVGPPSDATSPFTWSGDVSDSIVRAHPTESPAKELRDHVVQVDVARSAKEDPLISGRYLPPNEVVSPKRAPFRRPQEDLEPPPRRPMVDSYIAPPDGGPRSDSSEGGAVPESHVPLRPAVSVSSTSGGAPPDGPDHPAPRPSSSTAVVESAAAVDVAADDPHVRLLRTQIATLRKEESEVAGRMAEAQELCDMLLLEVEQHGSELAEENLADAEAEIRELQRELQKITKTIAEKTEILFAVGGGEVVEVRESRADAGGKG